MISGFKFQVSGYFQVQDDKDKLETLNLKLETKSFL